MAECNTEINELTRLILQVCASCGHGKWQGGAITYDRKKSQCHSKRVRKWLEEIKRLENV
jgi:hypothetical protein